MFSETSRQTNRIPFWVTQNSSEMTLGRCLRRPVICAIRVQVVYVNHLKRWGNPVSEQVL